MMKYWNPPTMADRIAIEQLAMSLYAQVTPLEDAKTRHNNRLKGGPTPIKPTWSELGTNLRQRFRNNAQVLLNESLQVLDQETGEPKAFPEEAPLPEGWVIDPHGTLVVPASVSPGDLAFRTHADNFKTIRRRDGVMLKTPMLRPDIREIE